MDPEEGYSYNFEEMLVKRPRLHQLMKAAEKDHDRLGLDDATYKKLRDLNEEAENGQVRGNWAKEAYYHEECLKLVREQQQAPQDWAVLWTAVPLIFLYQARHEDVERGRQAAEGIGSQPADYYYRRCLDIIDNVLPRGYSKLPDNIDDVANLSPARIQAVVRNELVRRMVLYAWGYEDVHCGGDVIAGNSHMEEALKPNGVPWFQVLSAGPSNKMHYLEGNEGRLLLCCLWCSQQCSVGNIRAANRWFERKQRWQTAVAKAQGDCGVALNKLSIPYWPTRRSFDMMDYLLLEFLGRSRRAIIHLDKLQESDGRARDAMKDVGDSPPAEYWDWLDCRIMNAATVLDWRKIRRGLSRWRGSADLRREQNAVLVAFVDAITTALQLPGIEHLEVMEACETLPQVAGDPKSRLAKLLSLETGLENCLKRLKDQRRRHLRSTWQGYLHGGRDTQSRCQQYLTHVCWVIFKQEWADADIRVAHLERHNRLVKQEYKLSMVEVGDHTNTFGTPYQIRCSKEAIRANMHMLTLWESGLFGASIQTQVTSRETTTTRNLLKIMKCVILMIGENVFNFREHGDKWARTLEELEEIVTASLLIFSDTKWAQHGLREDGKDAQDEQELAAWSAWSGLIWCERGRASSLVYQLLPARLNPQACDTLFNFCRDYELAKEAITQSLEYCGKGTVFVEYHLGKNMNREDKGHYLFTYVVTQDGFVKAQKRRMDDQQMNQLEETVKSLAHKINSWIVDKDPEKDIKQETESDTSILAMLSYLYDILIQPISHFLDCMDPTHKLIFCPHKVLTGVPFSILRDKEDRFLFPHHTISVTPSLRALGLCHERMQDLLNSTLREGKGGVVMLGDPSYGENGPSRLEASGRELDHIEELFGEDRVTNLKQNEATVKALFDHLSTTAESKCYQAFVHLAGHGEYQCSDGPDDRSTRQGALLLSKGNTIDAPRTEEQPGTLC